MVTIGPGHDKPDRVELSQLVLDRVKGETTHVHQLAHVAMPLWFREKQPQKLGSHPGEQNIKNRLFRTHGGFVNLTALSRQAFQDWSKVAWTNFYRNQVAPSRGRRREYQ
jgi:hypothetical protein